MSDLKFVTGAAPTVLNAAAPSPKAPTRSRRRPAPRAIGRAALRTDPQARPSAFEQDEDYDVDAPALASLSAPTFKSPDQDEPSDEATPLDAKRQDPKPRWKPTWDAPSRQDTASRQASPEPSWSAHSEDQPGKSTDAKTPTPEKNREPKAPPLQDNVEDRLRVAQGFAGGAARLDALRSHARSVEAEPGAFERALLGPRRAVGPAIAAQGRAYASALGPRALP
ncbi:MAG: hypothetical protein AAF909_15460, partial [Pseudomonadota bacterium]